VELEEVRPSNDILLQHVESLFRKENHSATMKQINDMEHFPSKHGLWYIFIFFQVVWNDGPK